MKKGRSNRIVAGEKQMSTVDGNSFSSGSLKGNGQPPLLVVRVVLLLLCGVQHTLAKGSVSCSPGSGELNLLLASGTCESYVTNLTECKVAVNRYIMHTDTQCFYGTKKDCLKTIDSINLCSYGVIVAFQSADSSGSLDVSDLSKGMRRVSIILFGWHYS